MHHLLRRTLTGGVAVLGAVTLAGCGDRKSGAPAPSAAASSAIPPSSASPPAPESPLSVVIDARGPLVLSSLEGGLVVADAAHTRWARVAGAGELVDGPMPEGLPPGPGRVLGGRGRLPGPVWLLYETQRDDGKAEHNPLFRLGTEGWKQFADDWRPAVVPWTKRRILAASTSSGKLKIKVIEPSLPAPPDDLPSAHLSDASCEKTLRVQELAALPTGEVFAAGTCKPDTAAGAGPSASRYVVIRWAPPSTTTPTSAADAGDGDGGVPERPGTVDVMPGDSGGLTHQVLVARSPTDVWAVAARSGYPPGPLPGDIGGLKSRLFHFDGTTWGAESVPHPGAEVRGLVETDDGTLWVLTTGALFRRPAGGGWASVPFPGEGPWEGLGLATPEGRHVWISAGRGNRHVILRSRPTPAPVRWD